MSNGGQPILDFQLGAPGGQVATGPGPVWFYFDVFNGAGAPRTYDLTAATSVPWPVNVQPTLVVGTNGTEPVLVTVTVPVGIVQPTRLDVELCARSRTSGFTDCDQTRLAVPVVLTDFELAYENGVVLLRWRASADADATMNIGIWRRRDGESVFERRTEVAPADGTWMDTAVEPGSTYTYRLTLAANGNEQVLAERTLATQVTAPLRSRLLGNVPNPFNPTTEVRFELAHPADVTLTIVDGRGRRVRTLEAPHLTAGPHALAWNGRDVDGHPLPSGV
jgi:hypothetical protein